MQALPNSLRTLREQRGLTQEELAVLAGVDSAQLSHWETGKHRLSLRHSQALAAALGATVEEIAAPPNRIRELREQHGLTQTELGDRVGVAHTQILRWETGRQGIFLDNAIALANALGVSVADLSVRGVNDEVATP